MPLDSDKMAEIVDYLTGRRCSLHSLMDSHGITDDDVEEVEARLPSHNLEQCEVCDTWCEAGELVDDDNEETGICLVCRGRDEYDAESEDEDE